MSASQPNGDPVQPGLSSYTGLAAANLKCLHRSPASITGLTFSVILRRRSYGSGRIVLLRRFATKRPSMCAGQHGPQRRALCRSCPPKLPSADLGDPVAIKVRRSACGIETGPLKGSTLFSADRSEPNVAVLAPALGHIHGSLNVSSSSILTRASRNLLSDVT
jgi:hypothetical protein